MSERTRQRRLHVENRLAELRAKYGRDIEVLEDWGEEYFKNFGKVPEPSKPEPPKPRVVRKPGAVWDRADL